MSERIRKGSREYHFQLGSERRQHAGGHKLNQREAASFIRSLHSRDELALLRRLIGSGLSTLHGREQDIVARVLAQLESGRLAIWVVDSQQRVAGKRPEAEEPDRPPPIAPPDTHTVVIELIDAENNPVPFEPYRIKLPDGRIQTRTLDKHGRDRITGIRESGNCLVCFHRRDAAVWSRA